MVIFTPLLAGVWLAVTAICWCAIVDVATPEICRDCRPLGWALDARLADRGHHYRAPAPAPLPDWLLEEWAVLGVGRALTGIFAPPRRAAQPRPTFDLAAFAPPAPPAWVVDTTEMEAIPA